MAPLFHFRRIGSGGIFDQYATHFEGLLTSAVPKSDDQAPKKIDAVTFANTRENQARNEETS